MNIPNNGALKGITILDISRLLPGPYCSMILADHGARVIAVENKHFKNDTPFLSPLYRNKEHICLDLKADQGREIFLKLLEKADVVLEGFRLGVAAKLNIDYKSLQKVKPDIIYCSITGYGQTGPYSSRVGHDVNFLGVAGVLDQIGNKDLSPSIPGVQIADLAGGSMNGVIGILLALYKREQTGMGQHIDISMTDSMACFLHIPYFLSRLTGEMPVRSDSILSHHYAFYNIYETLDNKYLTIGAIEYKFWKNLCEKLNVPEYAPLQYDEDKRQTIIKTMQEKFKEKTLEQWKLELDELEVCWGPVNSIEEIFKDEHLCSRKIFIDLKDKDGNTAPTIGVSLKLSETPGSIRTLPVDFGQSTYNVLKEIGFSPEQIKKLSELDII